MAQAVAARQHNLPNRAPWSWPARPWSS